MNKEVRNNFLASFILEGATSSVLNFFKTLGIIVCGAFERIGPWFLKTETEIDTEI